VVFIAAAAAAFATIAVVNPVVSVSKEKPHRLAEKCSPPVQRRVVRGIFNNYRQGMRDK
jgi:hypothetical protein